MELAHLVCPLADSAGHPTVLDSDLCVCVCVCLSQPGSVLVMCLSQPGSVLVMFCCTLLHCVCVCVCVQCGYMCGSDIRNLHVYSSSYDN